MPTIVGNMPTLVGSKMAKPKPNHRLSAGQLEVMNVIWDLGEASVADVWRELSNTRKIARNTVQTTLVRLEEKGYLEHRKVGNAFRYKALVARKKTIQQMLRAMLNGAFHGSTEGLVMALLEEARPSDEELKRIRKSLNQLQQKKEK